jgi:hypothetical protein
LYYKPHKPTVSVGDLGLEVPSISLCRF